MPIFRFSFVYRSIFAVAIGLLVPLLLDAQTQGGNPPGIRWQQIRVPGARIIFDQANDSTAREVAKVISLMKTTSKQKVNILLQSNTLRSNGYVGLAPFRSEFYLSPPQNVFATGNGNWAQLLAVHEYTHVQQYRNLDTGLSHMAQVLFGEGGRALLNAAAVPNWYFEGGAVAAETKLSHYGRGRLPAFFEGFKALWDHGIDYPYMKLRNGSYKDFVPNHYPLGYMFYAYGEKKYGESFWERVSADAAAYKSILYPFQSSFKKHTNQSFPSFRREALHYYKNLFGDSVTPRNQEQQVVNELFPVLSNDTIFYIQKSYSQIPAFYYRTGEIRQKIADMDVATDEIFNYHGGKLVYSAFRQNSRWGNVEYGEIVTLDIHSKKRKKITRKSRYLAPDIRGEQIVAVHYDSANQTRLHLLRAHSGELLFEFPNPQNLVYSHPRFVDDSSVIAAVRNPDGQMSVALLSAAGEQMLLPFTERALDYPLMGNDTLYFTASYGKEERLMARLPHGDLRVLGHPSANMHTGNYKVSTNGESFVWNGFTPYGFKIVETSAKEVSFVPVSNFKGAGVSHSRFLEQTNHIGPGNLAATKYRKTTGLFNFHTLQPLIDDPNYTLALNGDNILGTFSSLLSLTYNRAEKYKRIQLGGTYSGWFPHLTGGLRYTMDRRDMVRSRPVYFDQIEPYAGLALPLNLSSGKMIRFLTWNSLYTLNHTRFTGAHGDTVPSFHYAYLSNSFSFSNQTRKARQHIYPRFAQVVRVNFNYGLQRVSGQQLTVRTDFYLPGLFPNHSLALHGAHLRQDSLRQIRFSSSFPFSRGYDAFNFYRMWKAGATYTFPVAYPDAGLANVVYLLRIRTAFFYDYTSITDFKNKTKYNRVFASAGTEWMLDVSWWNQIEIAFGCRYSYLFDENLLLKNRHRWEIILPVNLFR